MLRSCGAGGSFLSNHSVISSTARARMGSPFLFRGNGPCAATQSSTWRAAPSQSWSGSRPPACRGADTVATGNNVSTAARSSSIPIANTLPDDARDVRPRSEPDRREYHPPGGRVDACLSPPIRRDVSWPAHRLGLQARSRARYGAPGCVPHAGAAAMPRTSRRASTPLREASTRDLSPCLEPDDVLAATARNQIGDMRPPALERVALFIGKVVALIDADDAGERADWYGSGPSRSPAG